MAVRARHAWTENDDLVAFYLSRHGSRFLPLTEGGIAAALGMSEASLAMRQGNFAHLEKKQGLSHVAQQSCRIYGLHKGASESELRPIVLRVLRREA
jgi:hypothetical protein